MTPLRLSIIDAFEKKEADFSASFLFVARIRVLFEVGAGIGAGGLDLLSVLLRFRENLFDELLRDALPSERIIDGSVGDEDRLLIDRREIDLSQRLPFLIRIADLPFFLDLFHGFSFLFRSVSVMLIIREGRERNHFPGLEQHLGLFLF
jgi:hypothetical protein